MSAFTTAVKRVFTRYIGFKGRASRSEFWWWILFTLLVQFVTQIIDTSLFGAGPEAGAPLSIIVSLGLVLPNIAVAMRRLHDIGRTGWWLLIGLVPIAGLLVLLYFYVQPSEEAPNAFGPPDPLPVT